MPKQGKKDPDLLELLKSQTKEVRCPICNEIAEEIGDNYYSCGTHEFEKGISKKELQKIYNDLKKPNESLFEGDDSTNEVRTIEYTDKPDTPKQVIDITPKSDKHYDLQKVDTKHALITSRETLPTMEEVEYKVKLIEYIKNKIVDNNEDYEYIRGERYLKASGYNKFINYFKLNISYPKIHIFEDKAGLHCDVIARVEAPWGQTVEDFGGASMETMTLKKTRHNLKALATTRARTRAVRTIMGFTKPSYAEMRGQGGNEVSKEDSKKNQESMFE